jgi:TPR repeat protein
MPTLSGPAGRDGLHDARASRGRMPAGTAGGVTMPAMPTISVTTAAALAGVDRRTVRRWLGEGDIELRAVLQHAGLKLEPLDIESVLLADAGDAEGCADLALILGMRGLHSRAIEWIQRAADKGHADAMHWLARAYFDGREVPKDENLGLMWLAKSAALGHPISQAQTAALLAMRR